jgi:hypothetical protein
MEVCRHLDSDFSFDCGCRYVRRVQVVACPGHHDGHPAQKYLQTTAAALRVGVPPLMFPSLHIDGGVAP